MEGTPFGRHCLIELLGRGGMGEVWRAHGTVTDRTVAINVQVPANRRRMPAQIYAHVALGQGLQPLSSTALCVYLRL